MLPCSVMKAAIHSQILSSQHAPLVTVLISAICRMGTIQLLITLQCCCEKVPMNQGGAGLNTDCTIPQT